MGASGSVQVVTDPGAKKLADLTDSDPDPKHWLVARIICSVNPTIYQL
jgi:hypothetical protein